MVEVMKATGKPTVVTMAISPHGDRHGILPGECAVRLARAGRDNLHVKVTSLVHFLNSQATAGLK